jgi:hypothetical protein
MVLRIFDCALCMIAVLDLLAYPQSSIGTEFIYLFILRGLFHRQYIQRVQG